MKFFKAIDFDHLTVIVVFTKYDELRNKCLQDACDRYCIAHPTQRRFDIYEMPSEASSTIKADASKKFELYKEDKRKLIRQELDGDFDCVFVSNRPAGRYIWRTPCHHGSAESS